MLTLSWLAPFGLWPRLSSAIASLDHQTRTDALSSQFLAGFGPITPNIFPSAAQEQSPSSSETLESKGGYLRLSISIPKDMPRRFYLFKVCSSHNSSKIKLVRSMA